MSWKESRVVDQRLQFLSSYQKEEMSLTDLCHEYGISRPIAYKWIKRYNEVGPEGLLDLSRRPYSFSHATPDEVVNEILALRKRFPSWAQGSAGTHEPEPRLACCEHGWRDPSPLRVDQSGAQETKNHAIFAAVC